MEEPRDRPLWIPPEPPPPPTGWRRIPYWLQRHGFSITVLLVIAAVGALLTWNPFAQPSIFPSPQTAVQPTPQPITPERPSVGSTRLSIQSEPAGASVWLNGDSLGVTPLVGDSVRAGVYLLSVRHDGYYDADTVAVFRPGTAPPVRLRLVERSLRARTPEPAPPQASRSPDPNPGTPVTTRETASTPSSPPVQTGSLEITSSPSGATIFLNGEPRGTTPRTIDDLTAGPYDLRLQHEGYTDWTGSASVRARNVRRISAELTARTGTLRILAQPWGTIYVNGNVQARNADIWVSTTLSPGSHEITAVHPALGRQTRTVTVRPESTVSVTIDLQRPPPSTGSRDTADSSGRP